MLPLDIQVRDVVTHKGPRLVMLALPIEPVLLGAEALNALRREPDLVSTTDRTLLRFVAESSEPISAFLFCGESQRGHWRFDQRLSDAELEDLGYHVVRGQVEFYRSLLRQGVSLCLGAALGELERTALRIGTKRLLDEYAKAPPSPENDLATWVLRHLTFFTSASVDWVCQGTLSEKLPLCEVRAGRARQQMTSACPTSTPTPKVPRGG